MAHAPASLRENAAQSGSVLVGVLLALILGSGWTWAGERLQEGDYRDALRTEFRNARMELEADQRRRRIILDRTARLIAHARAPTEMAVPADSVTAFVESLVDYRFYTPSHPTLDDLILGGKLEVLRADELRLALLRYLQEKDRLVVAEERERRWVAEAVEPLLVERLDLVIGGDGSLDSGTPLRASANGLAAVTGAPGAAAVLALRWERTETVRRFAGGVERRIDRVLDVLGPQ